MPNNKHELGKLMETQVTQEPLDNVRHLFMSKSAIEVPLRCPPRPTTDNVHIHPLDEQSRRLIGPYHPGYNVSQL
jgi:hypothetical protein